VQHVKQLDNVLYSGVKLLVEIRKHITR